MESIKLTFSNGVMLVMDSSSDMPPFISFLGSLLNSVSCFCKSSIYSACGIILEKEKIIINMFVDKISNI